MPDVQGGPSVLNHWSLEQRKVYYRAVEGDGHVLRTPKVTESFQLLLLLLSRFSRVRLCVTP